MVLSFRRVLARRWCHRTGSGQGECRTANQAKTACSPPFPARSTGACNRIPLVEERLAPWLLMTRDRVQSTDFPMTQEFLSHMLGVRRVGVTKAAGHLQKDKLIEYSRGHIKIVDQHGLEAAACSCYQVVRNLPF